MAKKKTYKAPKTDKEELERFKQNERLMAEKAKEMQRKYKKWWDFEKRCWKDGFPGHGAVYE
jgi:hypothetical protein